MNVNEYIRRHKTCAGYVPKKKRKPHDTAPGSVARVNAYRRCIENGEPLFQAGDRVDCEGMAAGVIGVRSHVAGCCHNFLPCLYKVSVLRTIETTTTSRRIMEKKDISETIAEVETLAKTEGRIRDLERKLEQVRRERDAEKLVNRELELLVRDARLSNFRIPSQRQRESKSGGSYVRVAFGDTHGASIDIPAWRAFLSDMERLRPREIIHGGDIVDCGGWLAEHQTMNYLPETEYSYFDDISAANQMLDQLQEVCPDAEIHAIQGNHDIRPERWCIQQTRKHRVDAERLAALLTPEVLMFLDKRGINWYRRDTHYNGLAGNKGSIKLGKCCFTHPQQSSKHHASKMAKSWGMNVVFFNCFSPDTDVLTKRGWRKFSDLVIGTEV